MNAKRSMLLLMLAALCGCATTPPQEPPLETRFPRPFFAEGWAMDETGVSVYDPSTVFDYINGEAPIYFPYGFELLATATYIHNGDPMDSITADVYRMGSLLDAFGIYSNYRYPEAPPVDVGGGGFVDGYQLMFYQGPYFVRLQAGKERPEALEVCARAVAAALPGDASQPEALDLLAIAGIVAPTRQYIAESLLGYQFFRRGLIGEVARGDKTMRVFVVPETSEKAARASLDAYRAYLRAEEGRHTPAVFEGGEALLAEDPLYGPMAVGQAGPYLFGALGFEEDAAAGLALLEALRQGAAKH